MLNAADDRDHPRVCGEQIATDDSSTDTEGSSPRVRGAVVASASSILIPGIIPACAGSSVNDYIFWTAGRDHPRVCGEQQRLRSLRMVR